MSTGNHDPGKYVPCMADPDVSPALTSQFLS